MIKFGTLMVTLAFEFCSFHTHAGWLCTERTRSHAPMSMTNFYSSFGTNNQAQSNLANIVVYGIYLYNYCYPYNEDTYIFIFTIGKWVDEHDISWRVEIQRSDL